MPPLVLTGLRPLQPDRVGVAVLVFRFTAGRQELRAGALQCSRADHQGGNGLLGHGDGGCVLIPGDSRGRAGMGTQTQTRYRSALSTLAGFDASRALHSSLTDTLS